LLWIGVTDKCIGESISDNNMTWMQEQMTQPVSLTIDQPNKNFTTIEKREKAEENVKNNRFVIDYYKPTYILPYYYTASPYNKIYMDSTPNNQSIKSSESKFQFSFKVPIFVNLLPENNTIYLAYTQLSYWQVYSKSAFFRETDFEPEIFYSRKLNFPRLKNWSFDFISLGAVHQSNGFGGDMERTWNRIYLEAVLSNHNWMIRYKPWYIIHDSSYQQYNPNLSHYLGYGQMVIAYQLNHHVISLLGHSFFENNGKRSTVELSYSFPLLVHLDGYFQFFSGYGQSLIEYDHRTNGVGIGFSLSNWI
jgi:phospholipase A1